MTNAGVERMVRAVVVGADCGLGKSLDPKLSEDPEESEACMGRLVAIARSFMHEAARGVKL